MWVNVIDDEKVTIQVEQTLYENEGHPIFFIHVRIPNRSSKTLGIDLRDPWRMLYPNQWTSSDLNHRTVVNEIIGVPKKIDAGLSQELAEAYRLKRLTFVYPSGDFDYYTNFNNQYRFG